MGITLYGSIKASDVGTSERLVSHLVRLCQTVRLKPVSYDSISLVSSKLTACDES